ncbi:hypothetical protein HanPI659440_Chr11g0404811 [Helianthus annuus]|nr:hypothetical protein HanPI659440_Chr11g0404811 [Helianthus annuus]
MNKLDLTDFHINNLKSSKDLNISRWKKIGRWVFIYLSTLLHSKPVKTRLEPIYNRSKQTHGSRFGFYREIYRFRVKLKLGFQTVSDRVWVIPARVSRLSKNVSFVVQLVVKISPNHTK